MNENQRNILENIEKNGLLPTPKQNFGRNVVNNSTTPNIQPLVSSNIFATQNSKPTFGALTIQPKQAELKKLSPLKKNTIDGFDTDILVNSKYRKIDDKTTKLQMKIARLKEELEDHKKVVENAYLKADRSQYQKLLEIQNRMESEIQKLVVEYQNQQLKSVIFSPFVKLYHLLQNYVVLK